MQHHLMLTRGNFCAEVQHNNKVLLFGGRDCLPKMAYNQGFYRFFKVIEFTFLIFKALKVLENRLGR